MSRTCRYDPSLLVHTVCDLGISDTSSVGFYQAAGLERRMIDYMEFTGKGLPDVIIAMKEKPHVNGKHWAPHDIRVRELGTGKTARKSRRSLESNTDCARDACPGRHRRRPQVLQKAVGRQDQLQGLGFAPLNSLMPEQEEPNGDVYD